MDNLKFMVSMSLLMNSLLLLKCIKISDNIDTLMYKVNSIKLQKEFKDSIIKE